MFSVARSLLAPLLRLPLVGATRSKATAFLQKQKQLCIAAPRQGFRIGCAPRQARSRPAISRSRALHTSTQSPQDGVESDCRALQPRTDGTGGWFAHRSVEDIPGSGPGVDWVAEAFSDSSGILGTDLSAAASFQPAGARLAHPPRILVLYGSLRPASFSRLLAYECARLLELMGAEVRTYCPQGLPVRDPSLENHPKVQELRELSMWSEGHVWVSPEMHGCLTGTFKNQIDWIPLSLGSVRPTQSRTCAVLQVNGGSQSFNAVNELRRLARWMRMPCCTNQSSIPKAWQEFDDNGRMKDSALRDRVVDVMEEYYKFTLIMREHADFLVNRFSERKEVVQKGRLLSQAETEGESKLKDEAAARAVEAAVVERASSSL